jgi:hypothetical protein
MEELRTLLSETSILALKDQQDEVLSLEHNNTVGDALKVSPETSSAADAAAISETQQAHRTAHWTPWNVRNASKTFEQM